MAKDKPKTEGEAPEETAPALIKVKVGRQPLGEDGVYYAPGEEFETTKERAAALGSLVEAV